MFVRSVTLFQSGAMVLAGVLAIVASNAGTAALADDFTRLPFEDRVWVPRSSQVDPLAEFQTYEEDADRPVVEPASFEASDDVDDVGNVLPPPPADDDLQQQLKALQKRISDLESSQKKKADSDKAKQDADAKKPTVKWTGQLQTDFYWFDQDAANIAEYGDIENGEAFRRARIGMFGDWGQTEYRIEMDFALPGRPSFLDVFAGVKDVPYLGRVRVGHFFEPFSLERITANRFVTFMERSLLDQAFAPARNTGIAAQDTFADERGTWQAGVFNSDSDNYGDGVGDNFETAFTGRVTWLPYFEDEGRCYMHLGGAYSFRGANNEIALFRAQPEARLGATSPNVPFFANTGGIPADYYQLIGLEAAWVRGPLSVQSEYVMTPVHGDQGNLLFHGWYIYTSYFLTGEHRPYRKDTGTFDRVLPERDFVSPTTKFASGPGAWEVAFRVSQLDLIDSYIEGGQTTDLTVGLNWYFNPYLRFTSNYIHSFAVPPGGGPQSDANIFGMRVGYEF